MKASSYAVSKITKSGAKLTAKILLKLFNKQAKTKQVNLKHEHESTSIIRMITTAEIIIKDKS